MNPTPDDLRHFPFADALADLPAPPEEPYAVLFHHGSLTIGLYSPRGADEQTPHTRDETYVVARGGGVFIHEGERHPFATGDVLFAAAGEPHHFEDLSDDFAAWVLFHGPEGGEAGTTASSRPNS